MLSFPTFLVRSYVQSDRLFVVVLSSTSVVFEMSGGLPMLVMLRERSGLIVMLMRLMLERMLIMFVHCML